jgi:hypothetical protein
LDTYHVVLYIHLLSLLLGVGAATIVGVCLFRLRAAKTLADAAPWGALAGQTEKVFPIVVLGLFGSGAYMTSDIWTWGTGWIDVSIGGLALIALQGPLVAGRRAHLLKQALMENGPGELGERARRMTRDPGLWLATIANPCIVLGVVWNMTEKPSTGGAIASVLVAYAVGAAIAFALTRQPAAEVASAPEPAS